MTESSIGYNEKGEAVSFVGADAITCYKAAMLKSHIGLYQKCGMIPTRGFGISKMLAAANAILGTKYKRTQLDACREHLGVFVQTMKSALPTETR